MARKPLSDEEKYKRAYDGFDLSDDDLEGDDPDDAEMDRYIKSVQDGTYKPEEDADLIEPKKPA
jgi:hypothetical protein